MRIDRHFTAREPADGDSFRIYPLAETAERIIETPIAWDYGAAESFAPALASAVPAFTRPIEENTIPSWLWRHQAEAGVTDGEEYSVWHVIHRVVGAATYHGLQHKIFSDEATARTFYDEVAVMLAQRMVALPVASLASLGLGWAYGVNDTGNQPGTISPPISALVIAADNAALEELGTAQGTLGQKLQAMLKRAGLRQQVQIQFSDTTSEWLSQPKNAADPLRIMLNLQAFLRDGSIDSAALRHAVRLMTLLAALHGQTHADFGIANLSSLLLMLGQPYDSMAGRTTAAAVTAIIGAAATQISAELGAIFGPHPDYTTQRTKYLRVLRNRQRAAWGEATDYDHLSILPTGLQLDAGSDLALIAAAREGWDRAVDAVQHSGLHLFPRVDCFTMPECTALFGTTDQGLAPLSSLVVTLQPEPEQFVTDLLPAVRYALLQCPFSDQAAQKILQHIVGNGSLDQAPEINHITLQQHGFTKDDLQKFEDYLSHATSLRQAISPLIVGEEFCLDRLKLMPKQIANPAFNLLAHLGFSDQQIDLADKFVFGHGQVNDYADLTASQRQLFATGDAVSTTACIAMQAAVQPFAEIGPSAPMALPDTAAELEGMVLHAWRSGLQSLTLQRQEAQVTTYAPKRQVAMAPLTVMPRKATPKATSRTSSLRQKPDGVVNAEKRR